MATSKAFLLVEAHIRDGWMRSEFKTNFKKTKAPLRRGGEFEFDAVSEDGAIVACISANSGRANQGGLAKTKMNKIRSDILFLLLSEAPTKVMLLVDGDLHAHAIQEQKRGRLPDEISIRLATLSDDFQRVLAEAQANASAEMIANV
ncbi:MAG: hypothetical protein ACOYMS_08020 [Terrimicrobiaceae bacterium]